MEKPAGGDRFGRNSPEASRRDWGEQLDDYVRFVNERHRLPSQFAEDLAERALTFWLRHEKASLRDGLLLPERVEKLES